jgi:hypothetical protein
MIQQGVKDEFEIFKLENLSFKVIEIERINSINAEEYVRKIYIDLGIKIGRLRDLLNEAHNSIPKELIRIRYKDFIGMPDFLVIPRYKDDYGITSNYYTSKAEDFFFIEVKTNGDGLRCEQMEWIKRHPEIQVLVIYLKQMIKNE